MPDSTRAGPRLRAGTRAARHAVRRRGRCRVGAGRGRGRRLCRARDARGGARTGRAGPGRPGRARRGDPLPRRARTRQHRARRGAVARSRHADRLGDQAVRGGRAAEAGRRGPRRARRSARQVPAGLSERAGDHAAPAARPYRRHRQLHRPARLHGRTDPARPEHGRAGRGVRAREAGLRARREVGLQQLRLRAGRRGHRGDRRQALACVSGRGRAGAGRPDPYALRRRRGRDRGLRDRLTAWPAAGSRVPRRSA